jgi:hypothetical protein
MYTRCFSNVKGKMPAMLFGKRCAIVISQPKRSVQQTLPIARGAIKRALLHPLALVVRPPSWRAKTTRTEAAMSSREPMTSSSRRGRRSTWWIWLGLGHAIQKKIRGRIPIGTLGKC